LLAVENTLRHVTPYSCVLEVEGNVQIYSDWLASEINKSSKNNASMTWAQQNQCMWWN
jgi:hypothetical protein